MGIFSHRYLDSDCLDLKLLYSWLFIDPSERHYTTHQTSKFNKFFNQASTMLNNVFKGEVQSRITIISKERVKISLQIGAKMMKIG